jgi:hypothetical protein
MTDSDPNSAWAREASRAAGTRRAPAWIPRARRHDGDPLGVNHKYLLALAWERAGCEPGHQTVDATAARLLQEDLAELLEVSVTTIRRWERELRSAGLLARPRPGLLVLADVATSGYLHDVHEHAGDKLCVACSGALGAKPEPEPPPPPAIVAQARPAPPPATRKIPSDLWRVVEEHPITAAQAIEGSTWAQAMSQWVANSSATPALLRHVLDALAAETASHRDRGTLTEAWRSGALPQPGTLFFTSARYKVSAAWLRDAYDRATKALAPRTEYADGPALSARELARLELERDTLSAPARPPAGLDREVATPTRSTNQHPRGRRPA